MPSNALYIANHSSWWDGLLLFELEQRGYIPNLFVMVDEQGIKKFPIFQWIGAYSVNQQNPKHIIESIRYTKSLLQDGKNICIFPQGKEWHLEQRPLYFQQGAAMIAKQMKGISVVPITFYYTFRNERKAEVWIDIGKPIQYEDKWSREQMTQYFEEVVTEQLNALKKDVVQNDYTSFIKV
ncbi:lysophospholipid acyltransferase family protein [Solibacillus merdavium]|uniref:Lysophospholipid acyltransferase family protein n=1 Tax=Solibacillus merdavium TaxID=2762218 RepID=A0ABR8XJP9_9BACL|nr:lysophospholipid acyltransferase family protein [Solibacillus merdavium]MBD8032157.1 lysophospholipid acyltransferase family protein [Solibacillus merdavium]